MTGAGLPSCRGAGAASHRLGDVLLHPPKVPAHEVLVALDGERFLSLDHVVGQGPVGEAEAGRAPGPGRRPGRRRSRTRARGAPRGHDEALVEDGGPRGDLDAGTQVCLPAAQPLHGAPAHGLTVTQLHHPPQTAVPARHLTGRPANGRTGELPRSLVAQHSIERGAAGLGERDRRPSYYKTRDARLPP